jgi:hypothetical protein
VGAGRGAAVARRAGLAVAVAARRHGRAADRHQARHRRLQRRRVPALPAVAAATSRSCGSCARTCEP